MKKNLSQRIAERVTQKQPNQKAKNRAAFFANKEEIEQALSDGWSMKLIWETLKEEKRIGFSYQAFTRHVKKAIKKAGVESVTAEPGSVQVETILAAKTEQAKGEPEPAQRQKPAEKGFTFNPKPNPKELL